MLNREDVKQELELFFNSQGTPESDEDTVPQQDKQAPSSQLTWEEDARIDRESGDDLVQDVEKDGPAYSPECSDPMETDPLLDAVQSFSEALYNPRRRKRDVTAPLPSQQLSIEFERLRDGGFQNKTNNGNYQRAPARWNRILETRDDAPVRENRDAADEENHSVHRGLCKRRVGGEDIGVHEDRTTPMEPVRRRSADEQVPMLECRHEDISIQYHPALTSPNTPRKRPKTGRSPARTSSVSRRTSTARAIVDEPTATRKRNEIVVQMDWDAILGNAREGSGGIALDTEAAVQDDLATTLDFTGAAGIPQVDAMETADQTKAAADELRKYCAKNGSPRWT